MRGLLPSEFMLGRSTVGASLRLEQKNTYVIIYIYTYIHTYIYIYTYTYIYIHTYCIHI